MSVSKDISIKIKCSNEAAFTLTIDPQTDTVLDLKNKITAHLLQSEGSTNVSAETMRLIYSGKVLKDPDMLSVYKVSDSATLHMVRGSRPPGTVSPSAAGTPSTPTPTQPSTNAFATTPTDQPGSRTAPLGNPFAANAGANPFAAFGGGSMPGMPGMPGMDSMMQDPAMMGMLSQMMANPQIMESLISMNPQLAGMMTPEMRQIMQSDQFRSMVSNPQVMQQMMQMSANMGGMQGMGGNPFGMHGQSQPASTTAMGDRSTPSSTQPNPTTFPPLPMFNPGMMQMLMGGQSGANVTPGQPTRPPEEVYQVQLRQLQDMGFYSPSENVRALTLTGGNVEAAIEWLFSHPPGTQ
ncbi:hypothetical protein BDEG_28326 [Batrachochytrium dendrobatidis JEL423]|nr:hypothetical protein BDEG_28326 [Batrachochytrium dendrobatidis JEL423]